MLESETDDVCVWCKRPLKARGVYSQARNDLHYLQDSDDGAEGVPVAAIIGGIVFFAIVVFAVMSFTRSKGTPVAEDNSHWTLSQPGEPLRQTIPAASSSVGASAFGPPPTAVTFPQSGEGAVSSTPPTSNQGVLAPAESTRKKVWNMQPIATAREVTSSPLYFESADFRFVNDQKGIPRLVGDIVVVNDTFDNLDKGRLSITINSTMYPLVRFDGSISAPHALPPFAVASKSTFTCHVYARDFDGRNKGQGQRKLMLTGSMLDKPIKIAADVTGK